MQKLFFPFSNESKIHEELRLCILLNVNSEIILLLKRHISLWRDLFVYSKIYPFVQRFIRFARRCIRLFRNVSVFPGITVHTYIQICLVWKNIFQNWDTYIWVVNTHTNIQFNSRVVRFVKRFVRFLIIVFSLFKDVLILSLFSWRRRNLTSNYS